MDEEKEIKDFEEWANRKKVCPYDDQWIAAERAWLARARLEGERVRELEAAILKWERLKRLARVTGIDSREIDEDLGKVVHGDKARKEGVSE